MSPRAEACPVCGKTPAAGFAPFCSKRCADIDLGRWLKGGYMIPGGPISGENTPEKPPGNDDEDG